MQMLTIEQAAESLGISQKTVRLLLPDLGAVDLLGGKGQRRIIRIPEEALHAYLSKCRIQDEPKRPRRKRKPDQQLDLTLFEPDGRIRRRTS